MHKQVSGWTVNFCPNFPESPPTHQIWKTSDLRWPNFTLEYPPPPFWKTSDLGWPKFSPEYPPQFQKTSDLRWPKFTPEYPPPRKLQIWDDQSLLWNSPPPISEKNQIWDHQSLLRNTPPHFRKLQIWDDQSLLQNSPPPNENCERVQVREFQNTESYYMWRLYPTRITTRFYVHAIWHLVPRPSFVFNTLMY